MPNGDARRIARDDGAKVIPLRTTATRFEPVTEPVAVVIEGDPALTLTITRALAAAPVRVVLASPSGSSGRAAVGLLGDLADRVAVRQLDVTEPASVERLTTWLRVRLGRCDALVPTCGAPGDLEESLAGTRRLIHAVAPMMRRQRYGRIAYVLDGPGMTAAAERVHEFTRDVAGDLAGSGIVVDAYPPRAAAGAVDLPRWLDELLGDPPDPGPGER